MDRSPIIDIGQVLQAAKTIDRANLEEGRRIACAQRTGDIPTSREDRGYGVSVVVYIKNLGPKGIQESKEAKGS